MGSHPINLMVRFLLEMLALTSFGVWGWKQSQGGFRFVLAIGIPFVLAAIWAIFAVPNDPSRSGAAPIVTPGFIRFAIELAFFALAVGAMYNMGWPKISLGFGIIIILHYIVSYDRILWLLSQ